MAEVLAAFSAIASFLQLVEFTAKVVSTARELVNSGSDAIRENIDATNLSREYEAISVEVNRIHHGVPDQVTRLADECRASARKLLSELEQLRMDTGGSKGARIVQGTKRAIRAMRRRKEIEMARRTLQELNGILSTALLKDIWMQKKSLAAAHMEDPHSPKIGNVQQVRVILARKEIDRDLDSLRNAGMTARYESLDEAWRQTYEWALQDDTLGFRSWLQDGQSVYWVTGKAGSGKSTLMKYLCDAKDTPRLLNVWAGQRELVFAKFFFWYAGTPMQKSMDGLLRSILFQLLYAAPSLARVAFPQTTSGNGMFSGDWTYGQLITAVKNIAHHGQGPSTASQKSFCFFIDGLDEYHGNHGELARLVLDLAGNPYVRICVSSRPWNAFRTAFESRVPNLRLEELSRPDIKYSALDRIAEANAAHQRGNASDEEMTMGLVNEILNKAEGVFLWVILAVRSVCDGLAEGDDLQFLYWRVMSFPSDLEEFFRAILERADLAYRHQTYQALALAWYQSKEALLSSPQASRQIAYELTQLLGHDPCIAPSLATLNGVSAERMTDHKESESMSFVDFCLIRQSPRGLMDPEFPYTLEHRIVTAQDSFKMAEQTSTFLSAACKDLLYLPRTKSDQPQRPFDNVDRVEFLHRTVFSFLSTPVMQNALASGVPSHFRDGRIWHLLNLARRKIQFDAENEGIWLDCSLRASLTVAHIDLTARYRDDFRDLILKRLHCNREDKCKIWYPDFKVVATFIAFKEYQIFAHIRYDSKRLLEYHRSSHSQIQDVWTAALGESPLNPFSIHEIEVGMLTVIDWMAKGDRVVRGPERQDNNLEVEMTVVQCDMLHCYQNAWQLFLRKWSFAQPPVAYCNCQTAEQDPVEQHNVNCAWSSKWQSVWRLAEEFITFGADINERFFEAGESVTDDSHSHRHLTASEFIRQHVPREWSRWALGEQTIRVWEDEVPSSETTLTTMLAHDDNAAFWTSVVS